MDGDKKNNKLCNLQWGTSLENADDRRRHGTLRGARNGSANHNAKLSEDAIEAIFNMRARGMLQKDIARFWGVTQSNISRILKSEIWQSENATKRAEMRL